MPVKVPGTVKDFSIGLLHLPKRVHNLLEREGISSIGILFEYSEKQLNFIPRIGSKNIKTLNQVRVDFWASISCEGQVDWFHYWDTRGIKIIPRGYDEGNLPNEIIGSLPEIIKQILEEYTDERLWIIVQRRFGLNHTDQLTLEELGLAFGLTRERVRQLESFALSDLRGVLIEDKYCGKNFHVHPSVRDTLQDLSNIVIDRAARVIKESELLHEIKYNFNIEPETVKPSLYLILNVCGLSEYRFERDDLESFWGDIQVAEARKIQSSIERIDQILTEECALPLSEVDILVRANKGQRKSRHISLDRLDFLLELCSSVEPFKEGYYWGKFEHLVGRGNQVERILFEHGEPLHSNEITREINHRLTKAGRRLVNSRNLVNQISGDSRFTPIGRSGEWGLSSWSIDTATIIDLMKQYLVSLNKSATVDEIYSYVRERRPVRRSSVEAYLTFQEDFAKVDTAKWGLAIWSEVKNAQNWSPEQVGQFIDELFRKNRARKLKYQIVRQALVDAANVSVKQAQGMLNINPVIKTERDDKGELFAIFQQKYRETLSKKGARFKRKNKTLRQKVDVSVREILNTSPGNQIALSELVSLLIDKYNRPDKTFYQYISNLDYIEKFVIPDTRVKMCRLKRDVESSLPFPEVGKIQSPQLKQNIGRALTFLNENDIDIALFLLSKEFEATLKSFVQTAKLKSKFHNPPQGRLTLDGMINFIKKEGIITDQAILHFLRQKRNDRAHGTMPSLKERYVMMKYADTTAGMYIDYIKFFDDMEHSL